MILTTIKADTSKCGPAYPYAIYSICLILSFDSRNRFHTLTCVNDVIYLFNYVPIIIKTGSPLYNRFLLK